MAIGRTNAGGGGTGATLTVTAPAGVTVTATKAGKSYTRIADSQGVAVLKGLSTGTWAVTISDGEHNPTTKQVLITADYTMVIAFFAATIAVTYPMGSTCTCVKSGQVLTAPDTSGNYTFTVPEVGDWIISCTDGTYTASKTISITADGQAVSASLNYSTIPVFTYSGDCEIVDDNDNPITTSQGNWKIRLLTSGTFTPMSLNGAESGIDVFAVGGGGGGGMQRSGGGGGGYTDTAMGISLTAGTNYEITVGAGGSQSASVSVDGGNGGTTSAFGVTAAGGSGGKSYSNGRTGGDGGSGGGGGKQTGKGGSGGIDGSNGANGSYDGGNGQGTTTREFGEASGKLYSTGGDGAGNDGAPVEKAGAANTGDGGSSSNIGSYPGGSGIVVIRNHREEAA